MSTVTPIWRQRATFSAAFAIAGPRVSNFNRDVVGARCGGRFDSIISTLRLGYPSCHCTQAGPWL
jgi:hypothetical protein